MSYWPEIIKIVEGALKLNVTKVSSYAELLVEKLESDGNNQVARRLRNVLERGRTDAVVKPAATIMPRRLPLDQDSRLPVADVIPPEANSQTVFLNQDTQEQVDRFLRYCHNSSRLLDAGLELPTTMLLHGPPGCGKTVLAREIARRLRLPIVVARLDSIVSSYLGNTAKNIRLLFEYAQDKPCVLFLDEFDAIAKLRDDTHELGELKRVVNSLLQNIDALSSETILIAATNHAHILDPAVWRRFTYQIEVSVPDSGTRRRLIEHFLGKFGSSPRAINILDRLLAGQSGAVIEIVCKNALREAILDNEAEPSLLHVGRAIFPHLDIHGPTPDAVVNRVLYLRSVDPELFSFQTIGDILGFTRQWASRLFQKGMNLDGRATPSTDQGCGTKGRGRARSQRHRT